MKKLIIPILLLAMVACKKEDEKVTPKTDANAPVAVIKANLIATWDINKFEEYTIPSDSLLSTYPFAAGAATFTLRDDNTYSTVMSFGTSNGTYVVTKLNGKDLLILNEPGDRPDTNEVLQLSKTTFIISNRDAEKNRGSDDYSKGYMSK